MRDLVVERKTLNPDDWLGRQAAERDYDRLIREPVTIREKKGGPPLIVYDTYSAPSNDLRAALESLDFSTTSRTGGVTVTTRTFGYAPRVTIRRDFCASARMASDEPDAHAVLCRHAVEATAVYRRRSRAQHDGHKAITEEKVREEYRLPGGVFTSGVANRDAAIKYHHDAGNYKRAWSAMIALRRDCGGGHLSVPELGIGFEIADRTILLFDGHGLIHGVTPLSLRSERSHRFTVVYYSLQAMWKCMGRDDELERIKRVRTERERKRAGVAAR